MKDLGHLSTAPAKEVSALPAEAPIGEGTEQLADSGLFPAPVQKKDAEAPIDPRKGATPALVDDETIELADSGVLPPPAAREKPGDPEHRRETGASEQPRRIGRFILLDTIGAGAMGEVYTAYDGQLDRKVAVKLVHAHMSAGRHARQRLLREAQTLAQVSHPNVVQVYEAGELGGRVFLAMEYVRGTTLSAWLKSSEELPRRKRRRAIIRQFVAAGRGLQAAHEAGLAHRDFKPDNVLIGDDGRLRVVDFGLARVVATADDTTENSAAEDSAAEGPAAEGPAPTGLEDTMDADPDGPRPDPDPRRPDVTPGQKAAIVLTATGSILGTPRFMSPEQMRGELADSRSDQFSFCIALFNALFGRFPYPGESFAALQKSVQSGAIEPPRSHEAPARIRRALLRGLAAEPDKRFPSMSQLLDELERWLRAGQRRAFTLMALLAALGVTFGVVQQRGAQESLPKCDGGPDQLAKVWYPERHGLIERAILAVDTPYAKEAWEQVDSGLEQYSGQWVAMHKEACLTHRRGEDSGAMLDKRMACLDRRLDAMDQALSVLAETDEKSLAQTVDVVQKLPLIDYCADTEALNAEVPPPEDPATRAQVDDLRAGLSHVRSLENMGRYLDAEAEAKSLVDEAEGLSYPPVLAEALLAAGRVRMQISDKDTLALLERASSIGFRSGTDVIALEALARQVYVEVISAKDKNTLVPPRPMAEALAARSQDRVFAYALLLNNVGVMLWSRGEPERAREYFERAIAAKSNTVMEDDLELVSVHTNLAMLTRDDARRTEIFRQATQILEQRLGPTHPLSIDTRKNYAQFNASPTQAREIIQPACDRYAQFHPDRILDRMYCLLYLSFFLDELGELSAAAKVLSPLHSHQGDNDFLDLRLGRGYAFLFAGNHEAALAEFREFNAGLEGKSSRWHDKRRAIANLGGAISEYALGRPGEAIAPLESAIAWFQAEIQRTTEPTNLRFLARARVALAESLWSVSENRRGADATDLRQRACSEIELALTWYRSAGPDYAWRVQALTSWHARCPSLAR